MSVTLRFCGAARTVTGSCCLFETAGARLLVDNGSPNSTARPTTSTLPRLQGEQIGGKAADVAEDHAAFADCPRSPMAMPMSACRNAGASLTPSRVTATISPAS